MLPHQLSSAQFSKYPQQARDLATRQTDLLQKLPLAFLPLLLRELIEYDWKFPMERRELEKQFAYLRGLSADQLSQFVSPFAQLQLSPELERVDWVNTPGQFSEQLTAHLWGTHQIDAFRAAAVDYVAKINAASPAEPPALPRLTIVIVGQGVAQNKFPLFRKLRPQGVYFQQVDPANGNRIILDAMAARADAHPVPFGHWYLDGGRAEAVASAALTCMSYGALQRVRTALLGRMERAMQSGSGSEALRTSLAQMKPDDLGVDGSGPDAVLNRFEISVLTEGSGTQIFSTTFVQWSAREILRRAQPITLLARFAPRQREQSMKDLLAARQEKPELDPAGSLTDADMGAYYTWINQQRLAGAEQASFLVWFEGHGEAVAIAPSLPRGAVSDKAITIGQLLTRIT